MSADVDVERATVDAASLRPYLSLVLLQIETDADPAAIFGRLAREIRREQEAGRRTLELVAQGLRGFDARADDDSPLFDESLALVWRRSRAPSWATELSPYVDVEHELCLCLRSGQFIAVHGEDILRRAILRWIDKPPRPPIRRVRPGVLNACFLAGSDSKNLWLRGVRATTATRPDSKALAGTSLASSLDPIGDGAFRLSSARVSLPVSPERLYVTGTVGATPRDAKVWSGPTQDMVEFANSVREVLNLVRATIASGSELANPYPLLAAPVDGLAGVHGAYEFRVPPSTDLLVGDEVSQERFDAARRLEDVTILTDPVAGTADAILQVGYDGRIAGRLRASVRENSDRVRVRLGHEGAPTDSGAVSQILADLDQLALYSIHYASGHAVFEDGVFAERQDTAAFGNWQFRSFEGYRVDHEKPVVAKGQSIHDAIAQSGDNSLFGWVAQAFNDGVLLCDDGAGEIADFLHVADDGKLSLIHVKSATTPSPHRRVAVAPYEVVVSQAVKNLVNLRPSTLCERLAAPSSTSRAAWTAGRRVPGVQDFLDSLACRDARDPCEVVVVQPHVTRSRHSALRRDDSSGSSLDMHRLRLLDTLLNAALVACIGSNAQFTVIGAA